jgi:hypothetical protein
MSSALDAMADSIGSAKRGRGGIYFLDGVYPILFADKIQPQKNRHNEDQIIGEYDILESEVEERAPGTRVSQIYNLTKHRETAPGNARAMIGALLGVKEEDLVNVPEEQRPVIAKILGLKVEQCAAIDGGIIRKVLGDENPLHGRIVRAQATVVKTKKNEDFTRVDFFPLPEDMQAMAGELRSAAGFPPI